MEARCFGRWRPVRLLDAAVIDVLHDLVDAGAEALLARVDLVDLFTRLPLSAVRRVEPPGTGSSDVGGGAAGLPAMKFLFHL